MTIVKHSKRTLRKPCSKCGTSGLYWGHDTDAPGRGCPECGLPSARWILLEHDGQTVHNCTGTHATVTTDKGDDMHETTPTPKVEEVTAPGASPDALAALAALTQALTPSVSREDIERIVREEFGKVVFPQRVIVERASGETREVKGHTHAKTADVVSDLLAGEHVMMVGPAGTGKSTIASQAAEALGLPYASVSLSPAMTPTQLIGYMQATGEYVGSLFRQTFEHGGVFHFDEIDNAHPSVLAVINAALANGETAFPDRMVKRHPDFRAVASANTYGRGADRAYVGRQAIDAATLDRFTVETVTVDESLEESLCVETGASAETVARVLAEVRKLRANAETHRLPVAISPRASVGMCRLLTAGRTWEDAVEARLRRGMSDADWNKLTA